MANVPFENKLVPAVVGQKIANTGDIEQTDDQLFVSQAEKDKIGSSTSTESFTELTDTPSNYNFPEQQKFLVANSSANQIQFIDLNTDDINDFNIITPESGDVLKFSSTANKWVNDTIRRVAGIASTNDKEDIYTLGDNSIGVVWNTKNEVVNVSINQSVEYGDIIMVLNLATDPLHTVNLITTPPRLIDGATNYSVAGSTIALFTYDDTDDEWKYVGEQSLILSLGNHSIEELSDITSKGSGSIITTAERNKLAALDDNAADSIEIVSSLTITAANFEDYDNRVIESKATSYIEVVLPAIENLPVEKVSFTVCNNSPSGLSLNIIPNIADNGFTNNHTGKIFPGESVTIVKPKNGNHKWLIESFVIDNQFVEIDSDTPVTISTDIRRQRVSYTGVPVPADFNQQLPVVYEFEDDCRLIFVNEFNDINHKVTLLPSGIDTIEANADFELRGGQLVELEPLPNEGKWVVRNYVRNRTINIVEGSTKVENITELEFNSTDFTATDSGGGIALVESKGVTIAGDSTIQSKTIVVNTGNLSVSDDGGGNPEIDFKGITVNGNGNKKELIFNTDNFVVDGGTEGISNVDLKSIASGENSGLYASLYEVTNISDDLTSNTTKSIFFDDIVSHVGNLITYNKSNKTYTLNPISNGEKTGYILFGRFSDAGSPTIDGYLDIILRNADSDAIISDVNGNLLAKQRKIKAGDTGIAVDVYGYIEIDQPLTFKVDLESNYAGGSIRLNSRIDGCSCIMAQQVTEDEQTGISLLQMESDLNISLKFGQLVFDDKVRTIDDVVGHVIVPETTKSAGTNSYISPGVLFHGVSDYKFQIGSGGVEVRNPDGSGLFGSYNSFFTAEETYALQGQTIFVNGSILQYAQGMKMALAYWKGEPDKETTSIITGWNPIGTPHKEVIADNWNIDWGNVLDIPIDSDTQTVPFTINTSFLIPENVSNFAIVLWTIPVDEGPIEQNYPQQVKLQEYNIGIPGEGFSTIVFAPIVEKDEVYLEETATLAVFGADSYNYSGGKFGIGDIDEPLPVGPKLRGNAEITDVGYVSTGPASDYLLFNVEGDADIYNSFYLYANDDVLNPGQTATGSFWWSTVDDQGASTKIPTTETFWSVTEGQTSPIYIAPAVKTVGVNPGDKLRLYSTCSVPFGAYLKSPNAGNYMVYTRIQMNVLNKEREEILSNLALDESKNRVTSGLSYQFPSGSVYLGDSTIESGGRQLSFKSDSIPNIKGSLVTQNYDDTNYSKAKVFDDTEVASVVDVQISDYTVSGLLKELKYHYVKQGNGQINKIQIKPNGVVSADFIFEFRFADTGETIYKDTIDYTTLVDLGGGIYEFALSHPVILNDGDGLFIRSKSISLLGGEGFDGTDLIRTGDSTENYFFPYLKFNEIPIVYQNIATEDYVSTVADTKLNLNGDNVDIPFIINDGTNDRLIINSTNSTLKSPDGNNKLELYDDLILAHNGVNARLRINDLKSSLFSPDGNKELKVTDDSIVLTGNVGIDIIPVTSWNTNYSVLQLGYGSSIASNISSPVGLLLLNNTYNDGTNWRYIHDGVASSMLLDTNGAIQYFISESGLAGDIATDNNGIFKITSDGKFGLGTIDPKSQLDIVNSTTAPVLSLRRDSDTIISNDSLGSILYTANDPDNTGGYGALITGVATDAWSTDYYPSRLEFYTNDGGPTYDEKLRIDDKITSNCNLKYSSTSTMGTTDEDIAHKKYVDDLVAYPESTTLTDANTATVQGVYTVTDTTTNIPSGLFTAWITTCKLRVTCNDTTNVLQELLFTDYDTATPYVNSIFYRVKDGSNWSDWKEISNKDYVDASRNTDQMKAYLSIGLTLDGTEQVIAFNTVIQNEGLTLPSNGIFEIGRDGYYVGNVDLYVDVTGGAEYIIWIEKRDDDLSSWELCGNIMNKFKISTDSSNSINLDGCFNMDAGNQFRIIIKKLSGTVSLASTSETVSLGTVNQYSASINVYRVGNKITS